MQKATKIEDIIALETSYEIIYEKEGLQSSLLI